MAEDLAPLWVPQHDYLPPEDRSAIRALRASPGVIGTDDFWTAATEPASWNVQVGPGRAIIDGSVNPWTQGSYIVYSPSPTTIPVEPSHPTLDRLDVVVLHVHDQDNSTESGYSWSREVLTGTPGSGLPPTLPDNALPIRGLSIPRGSTAVRPENLLTLWPWWHQVDLRRPAGGLLQHIHDRKRWDNLGNQWYRVQYFDLQIPPAWRPLALWQFDVVVETQITAQLYFHGGAAWTWYTVPCHWVPRTSQPGSYEVIGVNGFTNANWTISWHDIQLWTRAQMEAGDMPGWEFWMAPPPGTWVNTVVVANTKIRPRAVKTHRIGQTDVEW